MKRLLFRLLVLVAAVLVPIVAPIAWALTEERRTWRSFSASFTEAWGLLWQALRQGGL